MGKQIEQYYLKASKYGLQAKIRLAMLTLIPSSEAANAPDTPENIVKFAKAMQEIEKQFKKIS